jgi:hypothetical protein
MTRHLHISCWWSKRTLSSISFGAFAIFLGLVTAQHFPVSTTKGYSERAMIIKPQRSHCKGDESILEVSKNGFHEYFQKLFE